MRVATFIDTSILVEMLKVPGKSQRHQETVDELRGRIGAGEELILPTAAVIETGNHIAQVGDGSARRRCAEALSELLTRTIDGRVPWVLHGATWDGRLLRLIRDGARGCPPLPEMAMQRVGTGDVSVLAEAHLYEQRVANVAVGIWTLDAGLRAYA